MSTIETHLPDDALIPTLRRHISYQRLLRSREGHHVTCDPLREACRSVTLTRRMLREDFKLDSGGKVREPDVATPSIIQTARLACMDDLALYLPPLVSQLTELADLLRGRVRATFVRFHDVGKIRTRADDRRGHGRHRWLLRSQLGPIAT